MPGHSCHHIRSSQPEAPVLLWAGQVDILQSSGKLVGSDHQSDASPCRELDRIVAAATAQTAGNAHNTPRATRRRAREAKGSVEEQSGTAGAARHAGATCRRGVAPAAAAPEFDELPPRVQADMRRLGLEGVSAAAALEQLHRTLCKSEAEEATARRKFQAARLRFVRPLIDTPATLPETV